MNEPILWSYTVSPAAKVDIRKVLRWIRDHFGVAASLRYEALLGQALLDLSQNPARPGNKHLGGMTEQVLLYHLIWSKKRVPTARVTHPRHFLLYRVQGRSFQLLRVLHDSRDLPQLTRATIESAP